MARFGMLPCHSVLSLYRLTKSAWAREIRREEKRETGRKGGRVREKASKVLSTWQRGRMGERKGGRGRQERKGGREGGRWLMEGQRKG